MPKYLGIDFLSQALKQKDQLLCRLLIRCPESGQVESVWENGQKHCKNEKQSVLLWDKVQPETFPNEKPGSCLLKLVSSSFGIKPESFQVNQEIEFVPSSNPDSTAPSFASDSFSDFEDEVVRDVCNYLSRYEMSNAIFGIYDSGHQWKLSEESMELEEMALKDCFEEFLRRVPRFHELATRLKPGRVQDPFLDGDGHLRFERQTICGKFYCEVNSIGSNVGISSKEVFRKLSIYEQNEAEPCYLSSPMINSSDDCRNDYANLESFVGIIEEKVEILLEHGNYNNELQWFYRSEKWPEREIISEEPVQPRTNNFMELNQKGNKLDCVETSVPLLLESPPPYDNLWTCAVPENHENYVVKRSVDLDPITMKPENNPWFCSPHSIRKITRQIDFSSKLLDKISSLILEVPDLKENFQNQQITISNRFSLLLKEDFTSELELQLRWDPLPKSPKGVTNLQLKRYDDGIPKRFVPDLQLTRYDDSISNMNLKINNACPVLNVSCKRLPWKDVYGSSKDFLKGCFDLVKEIKPNISRVDTTEGERQSNSPTCKVMKKPVEICRKYSHIHSGIDDFVLLRTGVKSSASSNCLPKAIVRAMNVQRTKVDEGKDENSKEQKSERFADVIEVPLSTEFQTVYTSIENSIQPFLLQLQETDCISPTYTMVNLTADYTRFILKQEKKNMDEFSINRNQDNKKYRMLICLHTLVTAAELLKECDLSVAQEYVKTICIQYRNVLAGTLDETVEHLWKTAQHLASIQFFHPKIVATCEYIREWILQTSLCSLEEKILVIIFRGVGKVYSSLYIQLQQVHGLKIAMLDGKSQAASVIDNSHVVITDIVNVDENFPWSRFTFLIAYEDKSEWLVKILNGKSVKMNHFVCLKGTLSNLAREKDKGEEKVSPPNENLKQEVYTLIGSSKVTGNIDLLWCLEQRCDIMIIEREYDKILKGEQTTPSKMCLQPDLMLDQTSGVIIENIINFASEEGYKNAVDLVLSTSFKCQMCSIILVCDTNGGSAYSFLGEVQSHLAKFHGCLVSIQASFPQFVVDVFYSHSVPQTASLIKRLCDITRDSSSVFSKQDWARRNWLSGEISEHERFLLGFPSLNSFSAQLMLNVMPLHMLLSLPFDTLKKELPWISEKTLKEFKTTADCGLVVEQSEDFLVQVPRFPPEDSNDHGDTNYPIYTDEENSEPRVIYEEKCPIPESARTAINYFNPALTPERILKLNQELLRSRTSKYANSASEMSTKNRISGGFQSKNDLCDNHEVTCDTHESQFRALGYGNTNCHFERPHGGSLSPCNNNLEQVIGGVSRNLNSTRLMCNKGKLKSTARSLSSWKEINEMPDVIGVVQPKPRKPEKYKPERPGSRVPGRVKKVSRMVPPKSEMISNLGYSKWNKGDDYSMKPKKRKLTFEVVPGAKNGQTRLTFV